MFTRECMHLEHIKIYLKHVCILSVELYVLPRGLKDEAECD